MAKEKGLISIGICWDVPIEPQNKYLDAVSYFGKEELTTRQKVIDKSVEVIIAGPGGFGTDLELMIGVLQAKLRIDPYRPIILLGEKAYHTFLDRMQDIVDRGRGGDMGQKILDNLYLSKDGTDIEEILCNHYSVNNSKDEIL